MDPNLDSAVHIEDTWQRLPGMVEFKDDKARGGKWSSWSYEIRHNKNTYLTCIWEPQGRLSGKPLPVTDSSNTLLVDMIHTIHWSE